MVSPAPACSAPTPRRGERNIAISGCDVEHALTGAQIERLTQLAIASFLLGIWSAWPAALALSLLDEVDGRYPRRVAVACLRARALIGLRRDDEAQELIASMPAAFKSREVLELRAWAEARRGEHDRARQLRRSILARHYTPAVHSTEPQFELLTPGRTLPEASGVTVFVPVRNEAAALARIPAPLPVVGGTPFRLCRPHVD